MGWEKTESLAKGGRVVRELWDFTMGPITLKVSYKVSRGTREGKWAWEFRIRSRVMRFGVDPDLDDAKAFAESAAGAWLNAYLPALELLPTAGKQFPSESLGAIYDLATLQTLSKNVARKKQGV